MWRFLIPALLIASCATAPRATVPCPAEVDIIGWEQFYTSPEYSIEFAPHVRLSSDHGRLTLRGNIDLVSGRYIQDWGDLKDLVIRPRVVDHAPSPWAGSAILESMRLDLRVRSTGPVVFKNNLFDMSGSAILAITGTLSEPRIEGIIVIDEGGTFNIPGARAPFKVHRSAIRFDRDKRIPDETPYLEVSPLGVNLRRLRIARGWSQGDLAREAKLSRIAVGNIETGDATPRIETLTRLADALGVDITEFLKPARSLDAVRFRAVKRMRSREDVLARVAQWLDGYNEVESITGDDIRHKWSKVVQQVRGANKNEPAAIAAKARLAFGLKPNEPFRDICSLLEGHGVKVFPLDLASDDFFGLSVAESAGGPAVVVNVWSRISVERWIFSAVHEVAHLLLHLDAFDTSQRTENTDEEKEANEFASHFLMPSDALETEWEGACGLPFLERVLKVKRIFQVSYKTVLYRLSDHSPDIWRQFQFEHKMRFGRTLGKNDEPMRLSAAEFIEARLARLVRQAMDKEALTLEQAASMLDISGEEMQRRVHEWRSLKPLRGV